MNTKNGVTRLLAINFGGLGDEVLFLPTLQSIRSAHPEWHITLLTEPRGRAIRDVTNLIDDSLTFDIKKKPLKPWDYFELLSLLRNGRFDIVLSSGASKNVAMLLYASGIRRRIGFGSNKAAQTLLTDPVPLNRNQHASAMYHDLVKGLGISDTTDRPEVVVHQENTDKMKALLGESGGKRRVLLHPGMSRMALEKGIIKTWSPESWAALIEKLLQRGDTQIILAGGPDDEATIGDIMRLTGEHSGSLFNAYGKTASLRDLVALMQLADVVICVDSAPMHLAVGLGKRLIGLFGPTDPAKLLWPDPRFTAIRDTEMAARLGDQDVFVTGMKFEDHIKISVDEVLAKLQE